MPDKHEVGGSSPLGPTSDESRKANLQIYIFLVPKLFSRVGESVRQIGDAQADP